LGKGRRWAVTLQPDAEKVKDVERRKRGGKKKEALIFSSIFRERKKRKNPG